jgi:hypothetical protein
MKRWISAALGASLALVVSCQAGPRASLRTAVYKKVLHFGVPDRQGNLVSVPADGARATVVGFFSPTCGAACRDQIGSLVVKKGELSLRGARLELVAVLAPGEEVRDADRALGEWNVSAPFLVDNGGISRRDAGVVALPQTLVLDAAGLVTYVAPDDAMADDVLAHVPGGT